MNKIQKIQKLFHTDKWWGGGGLIFISYLIYILIFYFLAPLLLSVLSNFNFGGVFILIFLFIIAPIVSFFIPKFFIKIFKVNKVLLYVLHSILIIVIPFVFLWVMMILAFSHWSMF